MLGEWLSGSLPELETKTILGVWVSDILMMLPVISSSPRKFTCCAVVVFVTRCFDCVKIFASGMVCIFWFCWMMTVWPVVISKRNLSYAGFEGACLSFCARGMMLSRSVCACAFIFESGWSRLIFVRVDFMWRSSDFLSVRSCG